MIINKGKSNQSNNNKDNNFGELRTKKENEIK